MIAKFWSLLRDMQINEQRRDSAEDELEHIYEELVMICPHPEAVDYKSSISGVGVTRVCKVCGIIDRASEGGSPRHARDYYPGHPSKSFWANTVVEEVSFNDARQFFKRHSWHVSEGKAVR